MIIQEEEVEVHLLNLLNNEKDTVSNNGSRCDVLHEKDNCTMRVQVPGQSKYNSGRYMAFSK